MDTVTPSPLVEARWYVWATTSRKAKAYVASYIDASLELTAKATGLVRPQGYAYTYANDGLSGTDLFGTAIGLGGESSDESLIRYRVDAT